MLPNAKEFVCSIRTASANEHRVRSAPSQVAGHLMPRRHGIQHRMLASHRPLRAIWQRVGNAQPNGGSGARHIALQHDRGAPHARIGHRDGGQQRLGVWMAQLPMIASEGAISTIRPSYVTATQSRMWRTTDRSYAMKRQASSRRSRLLAGLASTVRCRPGAAGGRWLLCGRLLR